MAFGYFVVVPSIFACVQSYGYTESSTLSKHICTGLPDLGG